MDPEWSHHWRWGGPMLLALNALRWSHAAGGRHAGLPTMRRFSHDHDQFHQLGGAVAVRQCRFRRSAACGGVVPGSLQRPHARAVDRSNHGRPGQRCPTNRHSGASPRLPAGRTCAPRTGPLQRPVDRRFRCSHRRAATHRGCRLRRGPRAQPPPKATTGEAFWGDIWGRASGLWRFGRSESCPMSICPRVRRHLASRRVQSCLICTSAHPPPNERRRRGTSRAASSQLHEIGT